MGFCLILKFQKKAEKEGDSFSITCQVICFFISFRFLLDNDYSFSSTSVSIEQSDDSISLCFLLSAKNMHLFSSN